MKTMKRAFALSLVLAFALLVAVPVSADRPVVTTLSGDIDYLVDYYPLPCDIVVRNHEVYTIVTTSYYDDAGKLLRAHQRYSGTDNMYNEANPDVVLSGHFAGAGNLDKRTGEWYYAGIPYHITVPGYGTVVVRAGRWYGPEYPYGHIAGKDSFLSPKDMEQFCACLAGK